ncbi:MULTISPECIES: DUF484 family protein [Shewanella]|jgi:hypothetical protein|uniref:DUF484 domain-containing protein n=5 Tax=Shewanella TaxID=22 RepID=A9L5F4_SHEB9|nr:MULTISPECIES: DUF484 family protein [Shewanella]MBU1392799.1 DUF484 family protein [Gammaproteobacteria bacterium]QYX64392.1 DUF484 family protein [Shewanella putrefaciens]ABN63462.1 protein of unknown function DUF484 [Shewanella baltica OS155]ABS10093.1 protein of unknown function DUF484 [Shewanella baltica OS185]ABX51248.1 protein of unknown function DUF484 [Shewanella baltica OS195]
MTEPLMPQTDVPFDELIIREYLLDNPDFFNRYPELLLAMRLPHMERGAISLVERRQEMLRQRVSQLEEEITSLLTMAARNEKIYQFNTELSFQLLNCADLVSLKEVLADSLKLQFNFSHVRLISVLDTDMKAIWDQRLHKGHYFGRLTQQEAKRLFGSEVGSVALTKLSEDNPVIFAIASQDATHFHPDMDNMLLEQLRRLLAHMLAKL